MAGVATEMSGAGRSFDGGSSGKYHQSGDESTEWRSLEQVENGAPSTSPPYWDADEEEDGGLKPSELYGKYTWKIDKFSKINKRELRSNAFEVGGYKWYILIYPQGCDVINHLSLFLCVANHDKLLPGWSHLAQFTIAVVNEDPKKSKYSDTLHRFWKKEHDWGWKKFMELPKVVDGFVATADTLIIKAQVQVIRERTDRPFRCLDSLYRRELVRVYLSNVETICRKYLEQQRAHLGKLIEDKVRWSSFCGFWLGMDKSARRRMSQENAESILKLVVKQFFVEKEVTSTLVMDSLYIGMKALESQYKGKKSMGKYPRAELQVPMIHIENDTFVLVDDVMLLLERAAMEPLPLKDEKGPQNPQNRTKDGAGGEEFSKDSIDRDEMRLTELGRRTIEIFVLQHIFSNKIEIAYQEAVALKRQEELIEEEAAWLAEIEQKARRGAPDKEKKSKKKQGKQKKNNRRGKDKGRDKLGNVTERANIEQDSPERDGFSAAVTEILREKTEAVEYVSDASDSIDCEPEVVSLGSGGRDASPLNWDDTDSSELHRPIEDRSSEISGVPNGAEEIKLSSVDDSSSTCSSDSVAPLVVNLPPRGNFRSHQKNQKTPIRGGNYRREITYKTSDWVREERSQSSEVVTDEGHPSVPSRSSKSVEIPSQVVSHTLQDGVVNRPERLVPKKENESGSMHRISTSRDVNVALPSNREATLTSIAPVKLEPKLNTIVNPVILKNPSSSGVKQADRANPTINAAIAPLKPEQKFNGPKQADRLNSATNAPQSKPETLKLPIKSEKPTENPSGHQLSPVKMDKPPTHLVPLVEKPSLPVLSRPLSAPLVAPMTRPVLVVSVGPIAAPTLGRSASATGSFAPEQPTPIYNPQSYQNAIVGSHVSTVTSQANAQINYSASTSGANVSLPYSPALFPPQSTNLVNSNLTHSNFSLGMVTHHQQHNMLQSERSFHNDMQPFESQMRVEDYHPAPGPAGIPGRQGHSSLGDESYRRVENYHPTPVSAGISGLSGDESYRRVKNYNPTSVSAGISGLSGDESYRRVENYNPTPGIAGISGRQGQSLLGDESYRRVENYNPTPTPAGISGRQGQSFMGDESYRSVENYHPTPVSAVISGRQGQSLTGDESYRRVENYYLSPISAGISGRQGQSLMGDEPYRRVENYHPTPIPAGISGRHGQSLLADEFPHLGIINDLLDDDNVFENSVQLNSQYQNFGGGPEPNINRQFRFSGESVDLQQVPSTSSPEFERSHLYNGFQNGYRSSRSPCDTLTGNMASHGSPQQYMNSQVDDLISNQWQMTGLELQYMGVVRNNANNDGNLYHRNHHTMEYPNLAVGVNGYTMFRPSNGGI